MAKKIIIACAAGGIDTVAGGDPCTQCESEKRKVARGALLCYQGRRHDGERKGVMFGFIHQCARNA